MNIAYKLNGYFFLKNQFFSKHFKKGGEEIGKKLS